MKFRTFVLVLVVALVSSVGGSVFTMNMLQNRGALVSDSQSTGNTGQASNKVIDSASAKSQNVYQAVAQKASPSVVGIVSETVQSSGLSLGDGLGGLFGDFDDEGGPDRRVQKGTGTGFVVDKRGYILTNSHVVSDGKANRVSVLFSDGKSTKGEVIWYDTNLDLAIVKVSKSNLAPLELGDSDKISVGDIAIAIGNPLGTDLMTSVTQGIISGLNRDVNTASNNMSGLIQTDASINPGNSGGPLFNQEGQVIGVNTAKANADNLGFSIPINIVKSVVNRVVEEGNLTKPILGISGIDVSTYTSYTGKDLGVENGIAIRSVKKDSIAGKAGVKPGDIIIKIGDSDIKTLGDVSKKLYSYSSGAKDSITVYRNGKKVKLEAAF